ncbi:DUF892 family protein [Myroides ceti]|uniref:DUF892 family protein n=1 Tax=Paenimyroides ceti TaxID=395087 RepID=A0ABT8D2Z1_9FLAO|nr:DUF892 family protein [Paenimyroides ceti]MDN3710273.1 DUF892 family protein [Paenimyroides ceti]
MSASQKSKHYEIAFFGTLADFAKTLGETKVAKLLVETLNEEKEADETLSNQLIIISILKLQKKIKKHYRKRKTAIIAVFFMISIESFFNYRLIPYFFWSLTSMLFNKMPKISFVIKSNSNDISPMLTFECFKSLMLSCNKRSVIILFRSFT